MASDYILSPVGRMVQGNPFEAQTTNMQGGPLVDKNGNPKTQYFFAVAFPKSNLSGQVHAATGEKRPVNILEHCQQLAAAAWPQGAYNHPQFANKILDGDQPSADGVPREGFAGCWIFRFSSGFPIQVVDESAGRVITDPGELRRGYFVRVLFQYAGNGQAMRPGMYCNAYKIQRVAYGPEIVSGPSASDVFSAPVGALPAGASAAPLAPATAPAPAVAPASAISATPWPTAVASAPAAPVALAPAPDFLNPPGVAGPFAGIPTAALPPAPAGVQPTAKAAGVPLDQYRAKGWTDDALVAEGYAVRV